MGDSETETGEIPLYGYSGGKTTYHSGSIFTGSGGGGSYTGTSFTPETFGIVSSIPYSVTTYDRYLTVSIFTTASFRSDDPKQIYNGRIKSVGRSDKIYDVMSPMIKVMFHNFPGRNGSTENIAIPLDELSC